MGLKPAFRGVEAEGAMSRSALLLVVVAAVSACEPIAYVEGVVRWRSDDDV